MNKKSLKVAKRRRKIKLMAVLYKGGKCQHCGYDKCYDSLEFHHIDPSEKDFRISIGNTWSWNKIKQELEKCIILCSNCHREEHYRLKTITNGETGIVHLDELIIKEILQGKTPESSLKTLKRGISYKQNNVLKLIAQERLTGILPTMEVLNNLYVNKRLSYYQIAFLFNVSDTAVRKQLKKAGIYVPRMYQRNNVG